MATFKMNRCSVCKGPLSFVGVANRMAWVKWSECGTCGSFVLHDALGKQLGVQKAPPPRGVFSHGD